MYAMSVSKIMTKWHNWFSSVSSDGLLTGRLSQYIFLWNLSQKIQCWMIKFMNWHAFSKCTKNQHWPSTTRYY